MENLKTAIKNTKEALENVNELKTEITMKEAIGNTSSFIESDFIKKHSYKLASHNSMSYLTPKNWICRPIAFTARCQSKTIYEQYEKYGCRLFDLRFKFNKKGEVHFAHGAIEYKGGMDFIKEVLSFLNEKELPVRIVYENNDGEYEQEFYDWCKWIEETYPKAKWFAGRNKWTWKQIYPFKTPDANMEDKYSSCNVKEPGKKQTGTILDDLWPWIYAKLNNRKNRLAGTEKKYLMIDFVEIN